MSPVAQTAIGVILAGGLGERFFPMTDKATPKYAVPLEGSRTFLELTYARLLPLYGRERLYVVTAAEHAALVRKILPGLPQTALLAEPYRRNTGAAAVWSTFVLGRRLGAQTVMSFFPADAWIQESKKFLAIIRAGIRAASETERIAILGIRPTEASSAYGYIRLGKPLGGKAPKGYREVDRFVEKPDAVTAARYLKEGRYAWNAGIFTWQAAHFAGQISVHAPLYWRTFSPIWEGRRRDISPEEFAKLPAEPIDRVLIEKTDRLCVYACGIGWDDIGSWEALRRLRGDRSGNAVNGEVRLEESARSVVWTAPGTRAVVCGVKDLIVAQRGSYLLICRRQDAQRIKEFKRWAEAPAALSPRSRQPFQSRKRR